MVQGPCAAEFVITGMDIVRGRMVSGLSWDGQDREWGLRCRSRLFGAAQVARRVGGDYFQVKMRKKRLSGEDLRRSIKDQVRHPYITGQGLDKSDDERDSEGRDSSASEGAVTSEAANSEPAWSASDQTDPDRSDS